jgi:hypothetical protein
MPRALIVLLVAGWLLLIGLFADISLLQRPWPAQRDILQGSSFSAMSGGSIDGDLLAVANADAEQGALLIRGMDIADAAQWPLLRYRFEDLAPTLEITFLYRRADSPRDVRAVLLPRPRGATGSVDLSRDPEWRGHIVEIGFAVYPVAQSVPPQRAFQPFGLRQAEFWSPSSAGRLAAVATEWSARRNWSLMSISALGPDNGAPRESSPVLLLALGLGYTLLLWQQFGPRAQTVRVVLAALVIAWLLLDLRWLRSLWDRHATTRAVYAGLPWRERQALQPDPDLLAAAATVRDSLRGAGADPDRARILVDAKTDYLRARLIYHLAPAATAPVNLIGYPAYGSKNENLYALYYGQDDPRFDGANARLSFDDGAVLPAQELLNAPPIRLYKLNPREW